jgi:PAS domain S-box-containing protein
MKKKITIALVFAFLLFLLSGTYIIITIEKNTSEISTLITLHQVELLRERLLRKIRGVQAHLKLKGTRYARDVDVIVSDTMEMSSAVNECFGCHHSGVVMDQLIDLKDSIHHYQGSLSRVLTLRANAARLSEEENNAYRDGEKLTEKVNVMISAAHNKLQEMTRTSLSRISTMKYVLFSLSALGPLIGGGLAYLFVNGVGKPLNVILEATKKLKRGDLTHRIGFLKDEFGEVAESFNEMASSLMSSMTKMEESEKRYRTLFERAEEAIFIFEARGEPGCQIVDANQAAAEMYGYTRDELRNMKFADLYHDGSVTLQAALFDRIIQGEWVRAELTHHRKNGAPIAVDLNAGPIEIGDHTYVLSFHRDISEHKKAEEALQRSKQFKSGGVLSAGLAHDLKNSIGGIKIAVEVLLEETSLSADDRQVLLDVLREVRRVEATTKSLLDFMRPPKPQLMLEDINTILDSVLTDLFSYVAEKSAKLLQISVVKDYAADLPKTMVDPVQLQQIFLNILRNAVESMPEGGVIAVRTLHASARNEIDVIISDTGKGISKEIRNMIFEPFFTTKPKAGGLGLSIAKRLVEQHNGAILLEHNESKSGAVFRISFPVRQFEEANNI